MTNPINDQSNKREVFLENRRILVLKLDTQFVNDRVKNERKPLKLRVLEGSLLQDSDKPPESSEDIGLNRRNCC